MTDAAVRGERWLWLLRHAKAAADPPRGGDDHDRPLAPRGRRDAEALGHCLADGGLTVEGAALPAVALCSTAARTVQTAEPVVAGLGVPLDRRRRLYYGSPDDALDEVRTVDDDLTGVLVVGHNPTTHSLALSLLDPDDREGRSALEGRGFPTCTLAVYALPATRWRAVSNGTARLAAFFTPPY